MNSHIAYFLKRVRGWETGKAGVPVAWRELPAQVRAEMDVWHHQMFGDASPLAAEGTNYHVLLGPGGEDDDVVTCEVHVGDNTANVYETKGQLGVLFPISEDQASDANHLYQTILGISRLCIAGEFNWELRTLPLCSPMGPLDLQDHGSRGAW